MIKRSLTSVAAGLALLGAGLVTAPTATSAPAPDGRCARYEGSVTTVTSVNIEKKRVRKHGNNSALVEVTASRGTPKGSVRVVILPTNPNDQGFRIFGNLGKDGQVIVPLPTDQRGKFGVRARYTPNTSCSKFATSASGVKFYRVVRRG